MPEMDICEIPRCNKPVNQKPLLPDSARLCDEHGKEFDCACDRGDVKTTMRMLGQVLESRYGLEDQKEV